MAPRRAKRSSRTPGRFQEGEGQGEAGPDRRAYAGGLCSTSAAWITSAIFWGHHSRSCSILADVFESSGAEHCCQLCCCLSADSADLQTRHLVEDVCDKPAIHCLTFPPADGEPALKHVFRILQSTQELSKELNDQEVQQCQAVCTS